MIKKILTIILLIYSSTAFTRTKLYLTASANTGYAHNPDLKSLLDENENSYNQANYYKIQRTDSNTQYGYSIEPRLFFDDLGLGLFIGRQFLSKAKLSAHSSIDGFTNESYKTRSDIFGINIYYKFRPFRNKRYCVILGAGGTYYRAQLDGGTYQKDTLGNITIYQDSIKDESIGFQMKAEINFSINQRHNSLFLGIEAKKTNKISIKDSYNGTDEEVLKLYFTGITAYAGLSFNIF